MRDMRIHPPVARPLRSTGWRLRSRGGRLASRRLALLTPVVLALALGAAAASARQLGSQPADQWIKTLESPNRVASIKIDDLIARLHVKPGDTVADIGAGSGLLSLPLAKAVSPGGKVYAVEIDPRFLEVIARKATDEHVTNVRTVSGQFGDPNLPASDVDLALFHDVLHHIEDRAGYLTALSRYLKPSGRIAVVEFDPARAAAHRGQPDMQVTKEQGAALLAKAGFVPAEEIDLYSDKWFVVYKRR